ncbi:MAG: MBL fold metallo-hydrolase [Deltaproteobacteria bacterium]|nr:MBL fold metallo-hydrolase [Deltaproteobacteria bacterium]
MLLLSFFTKNLANSSYMLAGDSHAAVIDPDRDVGIYLNAAKENDLSITHIFQTHLHADFVSGHIELQALTGAEICGPQKAGFGFPHKALSEGDLLAIDDLQIGILETPGHTPEHISYTVTDLARSREPSVVFCGDTLFVGDVGRPDIFPGQARLLADKLYDSLWHKLLELPDFCEVYPAHGAGSLCGRAIGAKRSSTIGYERRCNYALQIKDRQRFIETLTTDMPSVPDHFTRLSAVNAEGPARLSELPPIVPLSPEDFERKAAYGKSLVLDVRPFEDFGGMHVPGSLYLDLRSNFPTFAGWVIPADKDLLLVAETPQQRIEAILWLRRVGLDNVTGYLEGGMLEWAKAGLLTDHVAQIAPLELEERIRRREELQVLDVRAGKEFAGFHIDGSIHIPAPELRTRHRELDPRQTYALICGSGQRSSLGAAILKQKGLHHLFNVAGGIVGYQAVMNLPPCKLCELPHGPRI